jgi:hypothetical protein
MRIAAPNAPVISVWRSNNSVFKSSLRHCTKFLFCATPPVKTMGGVKSTALN